MSDKRLVRVVWHDAADEKETWLKDAEIDEESIVIETVGYVVRDTAKYLTLAGDLCEERDGSATWGRVTRVPKGMVQKVSTLVEGQ